jgi:hypothetical protein
LRLYPTFLADDGISSSAPGYGSQARRTGTSVSRNLAQLKEQFGEHHSLLRLRLKREEVAPKDGEPGHTAESIPIPRALGWVAKAIPISLRRNDKLLARAASLRLMTSA